MKIGKVKGRQGESISRVKVESYKISKWNCKCLKIEILEQLIYSHKSKKCFQLRGSLQKIVIILIENH